MGKLLKDFLAELYEPRSPDEKKFVDKHVITKFKNMYSGEEYDPVFKGSKVAPIDREKERHGYSSGADEKVYEEVEPLDEVLKVSDGIGMWISDFVKSDNPKFAGKSKKERQKQAIAAFYAAKRKG
jgi:hypothetical protein